MKKFYLTLLLSCLGLLGWQSLSAQQYIFRYEAYAGMFPYWYMTDENGNQYIENGTNYPINSYGLLSYTFRVDFMDGTSQNITLTPNTTSESKDNQQTWRNEHIFNKMPKQVVWKAQVKYNNNPTPIPTDFNEVVYTFGTDSKCYLVCHTFGSSRNTSQGWLKGYAMQYIMMSSAADDKPVNQSGTGTVCGNETVTLQAPCFFYESWQQTTQWEVSEDGGASWWPIAKTASTLIVDENDFHDPAKKYGTPRYYRAKKTWYASQISDPITFRVPPATPQVIDRQHPGCFGTNGRIVISDLRYPDGSPYTGAETMNYSIRPVSGVPGPNTPTNAGSFAFENLAPGDYEIAITSASGCSKIVNATINPPPAQLTSNVTNSCSGGLPAITINAGGGTAPYQYSIDNGGSYGGGNLFSGLPTGTTYNISVKDDKGCTVNYTAATPTAVITGLAGKADPTGAGLSNGSITVAGSNGAGAPYEYSIDGGGNWQAGDVFTSLAAGTYNIIPRDKNGCVGATPLTVTLIQPTPLAATPTSLPASCFNSTDGSITGAGTGGVGPYTYSLNGGAYQGGTTFIGLAPGDYSLYIKDANGNTDNKVVNVGRPADISISLARHIDAPCKDQPGGVIEITATGGTPGYTYSINGSTFQPSPVFSVGAGTYPVWVKDSKGCDKSFGNVSISEPATIVTVAATPVGTGCNGSTNGQITLSGSNGTPPYEYNLNNGTWQGNALFTGLAAGTYTGYIKDGNGCVVSLPNIVVTTPPVITPALDGQTDVSCFGGSNGTASVSATGGTGTIRYFINTAPTIPNATGTFTNLPAGNYVITAQDDNGCAAPVNVTIHQPSQLAATTGATDVLCFGGNTGTITLTANGGVPPYTYSRDNIGYGASNTFSGYTAGTYTVYVKDANGCVTGATQTTGQPAQLDFTAVVQDALCNGASTGSITVTASGGLNGYQYSLDGGAFQAQPLLTGVSAGNHLVSVQDGNGCTLNKNFTVGEPAVVQLSLVNKTAVSCNTGNDGSLAVAATGGTAPYTYSVNGGVFQAQPVFASLVAGNYTLTVRDSKGCTAVINEQITEPAPISITVMAKQDIVCSGDSNGSLTLQAGGGTAGYWYSFNGGGFQTVGTFTSLPAGNYPVIVRDANNCTASFNVPIVELHSPLTATLTAVHPATCEDRGSITVSAVNGGLAPYQYSLDNTSFTANNTFGNLLNGNYAVYIKDAEGCGITRAISPYGPVSLQAGVQARAATCFGASNGGITVLNVSGGNNNYEYSVNGTTWQPSNIFNNLPAGAYQVQVRDVPYSCQVVVSTTITQPPLLTIALASKTDVSCFGNSNGAIRVTAAGGTGAYRFSLNSGTPATAAQFTGLPAGTQQVTVTDGNGCSANLQVVITQPALLTLAVASASDVTCNGLANGIINLAATGGTAPYTYSSNGTDYRSNPQFTALQPGTYTLYVKDQQGCTAQQTAVIAQPTPLQLQLANKTDILCNGNSTGIINLTASGGNGNYAFVMNSLPPATTSSFSNLPAGEYAFRVTDAKACAANLSVQLTQPAALQMSKQVYQPVCHYDPSGKITLSVTGGAAPYTYSWNGAAFGASNEIATTSTSIYTVTVKDANGCTIRDQTSMVSPAVLSVHVGFEDTVLCVGQGVPVTAGNPGCTYRWEAIGFSSTEQSVLLDQGGIYTVTVTNPAGCVAKDTFSVVTSLTALKADFLMSTYGTVGDTTVIVDVSKPRPANFTWTLPAGARDAGTSAEGTVRQLIFDQTGTYTIRLTTGLGRCTDVIEKTITIREKEVRSGTDSLLGYRPPLIVSLTATPNPTSGAFNAAIKLSRQSDIELQLISFTKGEILSVKKANGGTDYEIPFNEYDLPQGMYLIALKAGSDYKMIRILKL
ncbi:SprB repeat-containing protein [Chitinophaga barathri]|uniref:T9SS C-terminal target domain-containing protein n=1 Tax=Chitinophaga barathri TaxID=1647451 RepID=A0A3N4MEP7_9BACT|nr:SprB repeat-containing protein [Chitinophaga barathri]RPD42462.1 hypothetical protein EG028_04615 [Chitinophaga barathri]